MGKGTEDAALALMSGPGNAMGFYDGYDALLDSAERDLVKEAQGFCQGPFSTHLVESHAKGEAFDRRWIQAWADRGFLGLQVPRQFGGHGASYVCKIRVAQIVAEHGFAAAFALNNLQGSVTRVASSANSALRDHLLLDMKEGRVLCAPAMSEPEGGSDLGALKTRATKVDGGWLLTGEKSWITNGQIIDCANLLCRVDVDGKDEFASLLVRIADEPTSQREEMLVPGARSFRLARLTFAAHFVPDWAVLSPPGMAFKASMTSVNAARVHVAAMAVAAARSALGAAVGFAKGRHAFGRSLLEHQGLGWELAEASNSLEAANALVLKAAQAVQAGQPALTIAAQAKKFAVDTATWVIERCVRAMGATGASAAHRLNMLAAETRLATFADGTSQMLLDRITRGLVAQYGSEKK